MNESLPDPVKGQPITAAWAQGVTDICRRMAGVGSAGLLVRDGIGGVGYETLPENRRTKATARMLFPWKVEWCASENSGEGSFVIFLPDPGSFMDINGLTDDAVSDAIDDLDDCEVRDTPWKLLDVGSDGGTVYLHLSKDISSGSGTVSYEAEIKTETTFEEDDIYIPIADISIETDSDSGSVTRSVMQYVFGEIVAPSMPPSCSHGKLGVHELTYVDEYGEEQTYHGVFCDDIDLPQVTQKTLSAGDGISISTNGNVITITNTREGGGGSETTGYTGTRIVVSGVSYNEADHTLKMQLERWRFENGVLKTVTADASLTNITTAVEETA